MLIVTEDSLISIALKRDDRNRLNGNYLGWLIGISSLEITQKEFYVLHVPSLIRFWKAQKERRMSEKDDIRVN